MSVLAEKSEDIQLELLRQYYNEKGFTVDKTGPTDTYENVLELLNCSDFIPLLPNEKDVELLLNAFFTIIITTAGEQAEQLVKKFCEVTTASTYQGVGWQSNAGVVVRVLTNFFHFHASNNPKLQFIAYKNLLVMSGRAHLTNFLEVNVVNVNELVQKWNLNKEEKREIFRLLHFALLQDSRSDVAAEVMTELLRTYDDSDADRAKNDARECVRTAVIDSTAFNFDHLLRLSAVKRLEKTDPLIYEVLKIFVEGRLTDYRKFVSKNPNFVKEQLKVNNEVLEKKMKMLTLISIAEESQVIFFDNLKTALDIHGSEDLEKFIIDAIRIKAISGKINEIKQELVVTSFQYRIFNRPQWELLQKKLSSILTNLKWAQKSIHERTNNSEMLTSRQKS